MTRFVLVMLMVVSVGVMAAPRGVWLMPRKDAANSARADLPGRMVDAPRQVLAVSTGAEVSYTRSVMVRGTEYLLVQAGGVLQLLALDGKTVWSFAKPGIQDVLRVDDFDGDKASEAFVRLDNRTAALLDVATGAVLWQWSCDPSTFLSGLAFQPVRGGVRFICFPAYSADGYCFDFRGHRAQPTLLWQRSYRGYDVGFGPSIVLADMDGDGTTDIALSGKKHGVYQAVLDGETGAVKYDAQFDIPGETGRPYGLLQARDLDGDGLPELVMAACQVEEYLAVTKNDGRSLRLLWGHFVEKDWPKDDLELRPQVTSLADIQGNGKVELIVGLWRDGAWTTAIIDPLQGFTARRGELPGWYCWGCHDVNGDGVAEVLVSQETTRLPARMTTLQALDGKTLKPVLTLEDAAFFTSDDSALPADRFFMAQRHSPVTATLPDGRTTVIVRRYHHGKDRGLSAWGTVRGNPAVITQILSAGPPTRRIERLSTGYALVLHDGAILLTDGKFSVRRRVGAQGRMASPLVWAQGGQREIVVDCAGSYIRAFPLRGNDIGPFRDYPGTLPALHVDTAGVARLTVAELSDPDHPRAVIYRMDGTRVEIPLSHPAYLGVTLFGSTYRLLVNLQTGVHTMALACYDATGTLLWQDTQYGAHPRVPAAADVNGDGVEELIADDHGILRVHLADGTVIGNHPGWPPAYSLPIIGPYGPNGTTAILRAGAIDGITLNDAGGKELWAVRKPPEERFRWSNGFPAVGDMDGHGAFGVGMMADDGTFECLDTRTGALRWRLALGTAPRATSVIAGDVDGNGADEFVVALPDGRVVCLGEAEGQGVIRWTIVLPAAAANPLLADVDGDGLVELLVATGDGMVRVFK